MSDQDVSELWQAIDEMRRDQREHGQILVRIDAQLSERCDVRARAHTGLEARVVALEHRVWWASGFAAAAGMAGGWLLKVMG